MVIQSHAEEPSLRHGGVMNEGKVSQRLGLPGNPVEAESIMIYQFSPAMTLNMPEGTRMNPVLSAMDKQWLMKMYPKTRYSCQNGNCVESKDGEYDIINDCYEKCGTYSYVFPEHDPSKCSECGITMNVHAECRDKNGNKVDSAACANLETPLPQEYKCPECGTTVVEETVTATEIPPVIPADTSDVIGVVDVVDVVGAKDSYNIMYIVLYIILLIMVGVIVYYYRQQIKQFMITVKTRFSTR